MFVFMAAALLGTTLACDRTQFAESLCLLASETQQLGGRSADGRTFKVQLDAVRKHFQVRFFQTGRRAIITDGGTPQARVDTGFVFVVHKYSFKMEQTKVRLFRSEKPPGFTILNLSRLD